MKKILILSFLLGLFLTPNFLLWESSAYEAPILDFGDLITDSQEASLKTEINRVSQSIGYPVGAILYNQSGIYGNLLSDIKSGDGPLYFGSDRILIALNLNTREMVIDLSGSAYTSMDDWEVDLILDEVAPYFSAGNYGAGINVFLSMTESICLGIVTEAEAERVREEHLEQIMPMITGSIIFAFVFALVVVIYFIKSMNNVKDQKNASAYVSQGGFHLTHDRETFLYRNISKVPRQQNNSSGGGGGGGGRGSFSGGGSRGF